MKWFVKSTEPRKLEQKISSVVMFALIVVLTLVARDQALWTMHLHSHNYPQGLVMTAYGDKIAGDLNEINTLNQYIGMHDINPDEIKEMSLFPIGIGAILGLAVLGLILPRFRWLFATAAMCVPIGVLAVIQYYLYTYGHHLDPHAPLRMPSFTPRVLGGTTIWNFSTTAWPGAGFILLFIAGLLIGLGERISRIGLQFTHKVTAPKRAKETAHRIAYMILAMSVPALAASRANAQNLQDLQSRIDHAAPGATIVVAPGIYRGPITISKPLTLVGKGKPEIRGNGDGNVVAITADNVTFQGFLVRLSGREVSDEAAGIATTGSHIEVRNNEVRDVYFGIHITSGTDIRVEDNDVHPGRTYGSRAGHAVNVWNVDRITVRGNYLHDARDGVILTYAKEAIVDSNLVTECRYGLHSMYSKHLVFTRNVVHDNLLGVALMYTDSMTTAYNRVTSHRSGATPYGFLLKDLDNLSMHNNEITGNQVGIYADGLSMRLGSSSKITDNVIAGNERGVAVMSNASFDFARNNVIDNLTDVYAEGEHISGGVRWNDGRDGNFWSQYHGFDANRDGIGDMEYRQENLTETVLNPSNPERAFIYTPAHLALETAMKLFPLYSASALLDDKTPSMQPRELTIADAAQAQREESTAHTPTKALVPYGIERSGIATAAGLLLALLYRKLWKWRPLAAPVNV